MIELLLALGSGIFVFGGLVAAWVALRRTRRIATLEADLAALRRRVDRFASAGEPQEAPVPTPAAPPEPLREAAPPPDAKIDLDLDEAPPRDETPAASPPEPPLEPPPSTIDWEQWLGVRGAALLGGAVLALAGVFLFRYSIEAGILSPAVRVALGVFTGLACIAVPELPWRRRYPVVAEATAGGGVVVLYAAFWAAHILYDLIPSVLSMGLMGLVTVVGCLLAIRHDAFSTAVIGLLGGFATPLLLSSGSDRPIGFFAYVLLLDVAFVQIAKRRHWPGLLPLSLVATILMQLLWIGGRMGPDRIFVGLGALGLFALFFAIAARRDDGESGGEGPGRLLDATQATAVLVPFAFAVYLAGSSRGGEHLWPFALLLVILGAAAHWVAGRSERSWLPLASASASVGVYAVWLARAPSTDASVWEAALVAPVLALVPNLWLEWRRPERGAWSDDLSRPGILVLGGVSIFASAALLGSDSPLLLPWLIGGLLLGALALRHASWPGREALLALAAALAAAPPALHAFVDSREMGWLATDLRLFASLGVAVLGGWVAHQWQRRRGSGAGAMADRAAAGMAVALSVCLPFSTSFQSTPAIAALCSTAALGLLGSVASARSGLGSWQLATVVSTAFAQALWVEHFGRAEGTVGLVGLGATAAGLALWPSLAGAAYRESRLAWVASALVAPLWFLPLRELWERHLGDGAIGALPLLLAALVLYVAQRAREATLESEVGRSATVWLLASAIAAVGVAIPLQLEREWVTMGWALQGVGLIALWRRLDHPGLKYAALFLLGVVTVRLALNPDTLAYYPRSGRPILNWLLYTYLVPAAALALSAQWLARDEVERLRPAEAPLYPRRLPWGAGSCGAAAVLVTFVWLNLTVADLFATGPTLSLAFERSAGRDLTLSIVWALYALSLLTLGVARGIAALRWLSLGVLLLTIAKVFLYDLGELEDLYRVASLVGLAISLMAVSLGYQRFVFRRDEGEEGSS